MPVYQIQRSFHLQIPPFVNEPNGYIYMLKVTFPVRGWTLDVRIGRLHTKRYRFFKNNHSELRVLLGLYGDSTEGFLLKNLYCLECIDDRFWRQKSIPALQKVNHL